MTQIQIFNEHIQFFSLCILFVLIKFLRDTHCHFFHYACIELLPKKKKETEIEQATIENYSPTYCCSIQNFITLLFYVNAVHAEMTKINFGS